MRVESLGVSAQGGRMRGRVGEGEMGYGLREAGYGIRGAGY